MGGDDEALPFADASFDRVISTFGVMFAPDHEKAAAEMIRVCRPGGRIGLASWTPAGFIGRMAYRTGIAGVGTGSSLSIRGDRRGGCEVFGGVMR